MLVVNQLSLMPKNICRKSHIAKHAIEKHASHDMVFSSLPGIHLHKGLEKGQS